MTSVISVFSMMLVNASSNATERGALSGWVNEDVAAALDMREEAVAAIYDAMQGKVLDGHRLSGWERRQPNREDDSRERVKKHPEKRKRAVTHGNAPDSDSDSDSDSEEERKPEITASPLASAAHA